MEELLVHDARDGNSRPGSIGQFVRGNRGERGWKRSCLQSYSLATRQTSGTCTSAEVEGGSALIGRHEMGVLASEGLEVRR